MDKTAMRNKRRRKKQKDKERQAEMMAVYNDVKDYHDKHSDARFRISPKQAYEMHLQINKELFKDAMIRSLLAVVYSMNEDFGYGKNKRLDEVISAVHWSLCTIGNADRTNTQFRQELRHETGIDVTEYIENRFSGLINIKLPDEFKNKECYMAKAALAEKAIHTMNIVIYAIYSRVGFRTKRLQRLLDLSAGYLYDIIKNDNYTKYEWELVKKADLRIRQDGMIYEHWSYKDKEQKA